LQVGKDVFFHPVLEQPLVGQGLLIFKASQPYGKDVEQLSVIEKIRIVSPLPLFMSRSFTS
jgi:hypothetical protein